VRERRPGREKQIVFMTGGAYTSGAREFLRSVQNEILEKPFSTREMMTALARCAQGRDQVYAPPPLARTSTS
jgi:FixJ family two-component response regulator